MAIKSFAIVLVSMAGGYVRRLLIGGFSYNGKLVARQLVTLAALACILSELEARSCIRAGPAFAFESASRTGLCCDMLYSTEAVTARMSLFFRLSSFTSPSTPPTTYRWSVYMVHYT